LRPHYHCVIATTIASADLRAEVLTDHLAAFAQLLMRPGQGNAFATMATHDLTVTQVRILHLLYWGPTPPAQVEVAEQIALSEAAAGRAIDVLVKAGLVERRTDEDDRRIRRVVLADAGRNMVEQLAEGRRADLRRFVDDLGPDERRQLEAALIPILDARRLPDPANGVCRP
jgi:DNA-binding MarR family transcriptional regulator